MKISEMEFNRYDRFIKYEDAIYGIDPFGSDCLIACYEETEDYWIAYACPIEQNKRKPSDPPSASKISKSEVLEILSGQNVEWDEEEDK